MKLSLLLLVILASEYGLLEAEAGSRGKDGIESRAGTIGELLDFRSVARVKRWRSYQASGYDRGGGFYDSGNFLRIESGRRYVLMEEAGAGCIDRMWFTYKKPLGEEPYDLRFYLDDPGKPAIQIDLDELFSGKTFPFVDPLVGHCGLPKQPGRYSYVPIGFQKYCKVVLVPRADPEQYNYRTNSYGEKIPHIYYQITYRKFTSQFSVQPFRWDLSAAEKRALEDLQSVWNERGKSPWKLSGMKASQIPTVLQPNKETVFCMIDHPGVIYGLEVVVSEPRGIFIELTWDDAKEAQVSAPLGAFFGCTPQEKPAQEVKGLWFGYSEGRYYCYWPMPFHKSARIALRSERDDSVSVKLTARYRAERITQDDGLFCAQRYDYPTVAEGEDYTVLNVEGQGHFAGIVMDRPGHMEGDDTFYVDGEKRPSIHGTGTEDFFNFAWGLSHTGTLAQHGITIQTVQPICYRVHLPAGMPFSKQMRIDWEHGHDSRRGANLHQGRYSGVVFYYMK